MKTTILIEMYKKSIEDQKKYMEGTSGVERLVAEQQLRFLYNQLQHAIELYETK